ncbi:PAS domain-containing protein [Halorubrum sp. BV1]|uniref:PAS domain-containing protein n=1 Tax=Halorubrum sp. BV1 TaxID=1498500 RepID=UPI0018AD170F|nr:PAS domain-containing protein [Halorubrum sp. BV1]
MMTDTALGGFQGAIDEPDFIPTIGKEVQILHIDDDRDFADLVSVFLHRERDYFDVVSKNDPRDGLDYLNEADVDCIVADYEMPILDGLDVLDRVRDDFADLPFILFTGKGSEEIASEAISNGVTEYLQKGGGREQYEVLANRIEQAVARHRAERQVTRGFHAIETALDGISLLDREGRFIYVNKSYADITGYDRGELLGEQWEILYRDEEIDRVHDEMLPQARANKWEGRTVYVRKDGDLVEVDHRLTYTSDDTMICTISDNPEAEEVREELSLKEQAIDKAPVGITITDPSRDDNPIMYINDWFVELTGYSREEVLGRNCRFLQGKETQEETRAAMRDAIASAEPVTVELRNYRKDGEMFWNRVTITPISGEDGEIERFVGFQQDVTERRER